MDFGMPYAQKQAWNGLKEAADTYAEATGNDIAIITNYKKSTQLPGAGDGPTSTEVYLALHGHGNLLYHVKQCLDQIKEDLGSGMMKNGKDHVPTSVPIQSKTVGIPVPPKSTDYHSQSVARSLTSTFQSLKLDNSGFNSHTRKADTFAKRRPTVVPSHKKDLAELNENLMFEDDPDDDPENENDDDEFRGSSDSDLSDDEDDDFDGFDIRLGQGYGRNHTVRPVNNQSMDPSRSGTSLPVTINVNFAQRPVVVRQHPPKVTYPNTVSHPQDFPEDTPQPSRMMASIQALARSVSNDTAQIFGDRPRANVSSQKYT